VIIPDLVTSIGEFAFSASGLTSVTISNSVTSIEDYAFYACEALTSFMVNWASPLPINANVFGFIPISSATLKVPAGTKPLYQDETVWKDFNTIIEENVAPQP
jgi:hypothetical protein